jgi:stage V sporulation protein R
MLARQADAIREYMTDPDIDRSEVEKWIDNVLVLEDNIDQHRAFVAVETESRELELADDEDIEDVGERLDELDLSEEVKRQVFDEEWLEAQADDGTAASFPADPEKDVLAFLRKYGMQYDEDAGKAVGMTDWQREILEILRREAYYFAPQKMTKVMNEGWAALWESRMMTDEGFASADEFISYADHMARVLGSPGLNPYKLGMELWEYIENRTNRREVVERLLRVEGVTWRNFGDVVDFEAVLTALEPDEAVASITPGTLDRLDPDDPRIDAENLERARAGEFDVGKYPWKVLTYEGSSSATTRW